MFMQVMWFGQPQTAWVPPIDLWHVLAHEVMPSPEHVLAQVSPEGSHHWMMPV